MIDEGKIFEVRAITYLRNHKMRCAREMLGLNQEQAAELCGITKNQYMNLEKMNYPKHYNINLVTRVAANLCIDPDDVMPVEMAGASVINKIVKSGMVSVDKLRTLVASRDKRFMLPSPEEEVDFNDEIAKIKFFIRYLPFFEREVLRLRYGLDGSGIELTLHEIGKILRISKERVRQSEARGISKIKKMVEDRKIGIELRRVWDA